MDDVADGCAFQKCMNGNCDCVRIGIPNQTRHLDDHHDGVGEIKESNVPYLQLKGKKWVGSKS